MDGLFTHLIFIINSADDIINLDNGYSSSGCKEDENSVTARSSRGKGVERHKQGYRRQRTKYLIDNSSKEEETGGGDNGARNICSTSDSSCREGCYSALLFSLFSVCLLLAHSLDV